MTGLPYVVADRGVVEQVTEISGVGGRTGLTTEIETDDEAVTALLLVQMSDKVVFWVGVMYKDPVKG